MVGKGGSVMNVGSFGVIDVPLTRKHGERVWVACQCFETREEAEQWRREQTPAYRTEVVRDSVFLLT